MGRKSLSLVQYSPHPLFAPRTQGDYRTTFAVAWSAELAHLLCREALRGEPETHCLSPHPLEPPRTFHSTSTLDTPESSRTFYDILYDHTHVIELSGHPRFGTSPVFPEHSTVLPHGTPWNLLEQFSPQPPRTPIVTPHDPARPLESPRRRHNRRNGLSPICSRTFHGIRHLEPRGIF